MTGQAAGVYGLFRLDGGWIEGAEARSLGLYPPESAASALVSAIDPLDPGAVHIAREDGRIAVLLGHIGEAADLGRRLSRGVGEAPLELALAAHDRYGDDLPRQMLGGWLLLRWDGHANRLTIIKSINNSYPLLVAREGVRLAVAPCLATLASLPWVSAALTAESLLYDLSSHRMKVDPAQPTLLRQVRALSRARVAHFAPDGERITIADPRLPYARWQGSFADAMVEAEALLRSIANETLRRAPQAAVLLSGGLDSSLLSWILSGEKRLGQVIPQMSSALAGERAIADEVPFARIVAEHLGEPLHAVIPPSDINPYRPRVDDFRARNMATRLPRHYLYNAFFDQALRLGVTHIFDGVLGEMTVSSHDAVASPARRALQAYRRARDWLLYPDRRHRWPDGAFAAWLAPDLLNRIPRDWIATREKRMSETHLRRAGEDRGYASMAITLMDRDLVDPVQGRLRMVTPFTDVRLLRLFAGMPAEFARYGGLNRSPARHMMAGHLPDSIRLRPKGPAISRDFHARLREHAPAARERLALFRKAGIGAWLDLDRLEQGLTAPHRLDLAHNGTVYRVQFGVQIAEYLLWWLSGRPAETERP